MSTTDERLPDRRRARKTTAGGVKLSDVATLAGVSTASVSRALNVPGAVSPQIQARVDAAIAQLKWIPNGAAKALASLRSGTIGALIPSLWHQNFAGLIESLQTELMKAGYTLLLGCSGLSRERELQQVRKMVERGVECVVLIGEDHAPSLYETLNARSIPYVVTYTTGRNPDHTCIGFDNYSAYRELTAHLLDLGHRDFGIISQPVVGNDRIAQRVAAARDLLAEAGIAPRPQHFVEVGTWNITDGRLALRQIFTTPAPPTAILCTNDYLAFGAVFEARARGINVPRDVSIVGFDDIELASNTDPELTTVHVPDYEMGRETANYIVALLAGEQPARPRPLDAKMIVRGSTGVPARTRD